MPFKNQAIQQSDLYSSFEYRTSGYYKQMGIWIPTVYLSLITESKTQKSQVSFVLETANHFLVLCLVKINHLHLDQIKFHSKLSLSYFGV